MFKRQLACAAVLMPLLCGEAAAADERTVTFFEETCGACHGTKGQGTPGLAPPLKGSPFVLQASPAEMAELIKSGRIGADKKFPNIPGPMPPHSLSEKRMNAIIAYVRGEIQQ